jgi:acyl carrier protein
MTDSRVIDVVSKIMSIPRDLVTPDSSPDSIPEWDSIKHMNLVLALEEEFGISFSDLDIVEMLNVSLITNIVKGYVDA